MEFEASRILSAVGAVLLAAGSFISGLGIVGVILLLVGLKGLADAYRDESIFKNAIYALIFEVAANGAFLFIFFGAVFNALRRWVLGGGGFLALLSGFGLALAAATILLTVGAYFYRKSFIALSARSREHLFEVSGLLLLIGAILTIILIGRFVTLAAWMVAAVAFFTIKPPPIQQPPSPIEAQSL